MASGQALQSALLWRNALMFGLLISAVVLNYRPTAMQGVEAFQGLEALAWSPEAESSSPVQEIAAVELNQDSHSSYRVAARAESMTASSAPAQAEATLIMTAQTSIESEVAVGTSSEIQAEHVPLAEQGQAREEALADAPSDPSTTLHSALAPQEHVLAAQSAPEQPLFSRDEAKSSGSASLSRWYTGLQVSLQWTGLLSQGSQSATEDMDPMLSLGQAFGVVGGFRLNERMSLESGLIIDSRQGSRYSSTVVARKEEVDVTKSLALHYTQVPLTLKVRAGVPQNHSVSWHYVGGVQYGMLRNSRLHIENKPVSPERNLREHDLALLLGMDADIPLQNQMFLSLGWRASMSATSTRLNSVDGIERDKHNAVLGFRAALNGWLPAR